MRQPYLDLNVMRTFLYWLIEVIFALRLKGRSFTVRAALHLTAKKNGKV